MRRLRLLTLTLSAVVATQAYGGGLVCWMSQMKDEEIDQYADELRAKGPEGLATALAQFDQISELAAKIERDAAEHPEPKPGLIDSRRKAEAACKTIRRIVDQVAGQRDASVSRLYWHTDVELAKQAAAESGKPILSLRMLGKLTDQYSCANSRFFRTALYSNKEISDFLRDNYILHWQSVRPVPRVTIDFSDGRKLQRTVTGNSAHYMLDAAGRPLDVLPGLYGPQAFREWLQRSHDFARRLANVAHGQRGVWLASYHGERRDLVDKALRADLALFAPELLKAKGEAIQQVSISKGPAKTTARQAASRAFAKTQAEAPLIAPFMPSDETLRVQGDDLWRRIAAGHADQARLDEASVMLIRREHSSAREAGAISEAKRAQEDPLLRLIRNFEDAMAIDTVKNEYTLHRQIHAWFASGEAPADIDALNEKVYAELFLTPSSDPWLGLAPANVYTALTDGGLSATP